MAPSGSSRRSTCPRTTRDEPAPRGPGVASDIGVGRQQGLRLLRIDHHPRVHRDRLLGHPRPDPLQRITAQLTPLDGRFRATAATVRGEGAVRILSASAHAPMSAPHRGAATPRPRRLSTGLKPQPRRPSPVPWGRGRPAREGEHLLSPTLLQGLTRRTLRAEATGPEATLSPTKDEPTPVHSVLANSR